MFRLQLIRQLAQKTAQLSATQECTKFTKCSHFRCISTKLKEKNDLTTNIKSTASRFPQNTTQESEQEFLIRLKNDPDTFGDPKEEDVYSPLDVEEEKHFEEQPLPSQKLRTKQYADIIKSLIKKRKMKEAIDVLEIKMLKEDKVKPEAYIYNLLLGACGRVGYTKKAFSLYNQMKKRGLGVMGGTYTALFNACANSPWPEDGLTRAKHLKNIMIEKMYKPNVTNYNAMIKAFGRCGDLPTAFSLVDEMASNNMIIGDDTMNFLLQACIQDKDAGFRHALLVWRKIVDRNIPPSLFTFNLLLRSLRDCGIGNVEVLNEALGKILTKNVLRLSESNTKLLTASGIENKLCLSPAPTQHNLAITDGLRPNLLAKTPHLGNIISLEEVTKPEDRLLLVGGWKGFLDTMVENNCTPDIKTFTELLGCLPGNLASEKDLIRAMKKLNVKPDIDFFNMLIKKRSMRFDYDNAKEVLNEMEKYKYRPDLITYGVLSLGCKTKQEALELLQEMKEHSYRLNTEILGAMLHQACYHKSFPYVLEIMEISLREGVKPNKSFMERLANFKKICKNISNDKHHRLYHDKSYQKGFKIFQMRYKTWVQEVEVDDTDETHPWSQYRQETETDVRHYKDKSVRFKAKRSSLFRVKTSTKMKKNK